MITLLVLNYRFIKILMNLSKQVAVIRPSIQIQTKLRAVWSIVMKRVKKKQRQNNTLEWFIDYSVKYTTHNLWSHVKWRAWKWTSTGMSERERTLVSRCHLCLSPSDEEVKALTWHLSRRPPTPPEEVPGSLWSNRLEVVLLCSWLDDS